MEKEISHTLLIAFAVASLLLLTAISPPFSRVQATGGDTLANSNELATGIVYELRVADRTRFKTEDSLSWRIINLYAGDKGFFLNNTVKEHTFTDTGHYVVNAYRNMREIARDTLLVVLGEELIARWPDPKEDTLGSEFRFRDDSRQVRSSMWSIRSADTVVTSTDKEFLWKPDLPGEYWASLQAITRSDNVLKDSVLLTVSIPQQPVRVAETRPPPKPSPAPWRPKPKKETPAPSGIGTDAFPYIADHLLPNYIYVPTEPPDRNQTTMKAQSASFEIIPKANCRLHKMSYFASSDIGEVQVKIECTSPNATGEKVLTRSFVAGYDAYKPHTHEFKNMPVLNKNYKYKMTITPKKGQLGFYPVKGNKFREKRQDGRAVMGNPTSIKLLDEETCVYNLVFRSE